MDKKELQEQELHQVSGGTLDGGTYLACDKCGNKHYQRLPYPEGWLVSMEWRGCYQHYDYKCPSCGYTWSTTE